MEPRTVGDQLCACGWRSGSVIRQEFYDAIAPYLYHSDQQAPIAIDPNDWLIVVSQSCDVLAHKDDAEPYIEILRAHQLNQKPRRQFCDLRSTRWLDFRPNREALPDAVLTAHATTDRYFIPRKILIGDTPSGDRTLSEAAASRLRAWIALRVSRPAWPGSFVRRVNQVRRDLEAALRPLQDDIAEVRVAIDPNDQELGDGASYKIAVFFVVSVETYEASGDLRGRIQQCFTQFVAAIRSCAGIMVDEDLSEITPGDKFTWDDMQRTDMWDFANLSPLE